MKVFISVDIEGCAGITHWDEARRRRSPIPAHGGFWTCPRTPVLEITDNDPLLAERHRWYSDAEHPGDRTIRLAAQDYFDILRGLNYLT